MDFVKLTAYVDTLRDVGVPGCDIAVWRDHAPIYRHMAGFRDAAMTEPMRGDETYRLYSCTKVFTTCAAMQLIEHGAISLDDAVREYLPSCANLTVRDGEAVRPARRVLTVRHLMSMQSGLDYALDTPNLRAAIEKSGGKATTRELVDARMRDPLCFEPGEDFVYGLSHDVLAAVIEAASGIRFSDYLKRFIFEPLGLKTVGFRLNDADRDRLCAQFICKDGEIVPCLDDNPFRLSDAYESGGAGLYCDVTDYITFADALACGGRAKNGARLLAPGTIQLWSANQLGPVSRRTFDAWKRLGYSYALGVRTRVDTAVGGPGQIGEFGWDGAAGAWTMIDPVNHLSAFFAMHVRDFNYSYDVIHPTLRSLIYEAVL